MFRLERAGSFLAHSADGEQFEVIVWKKFNFIKGGMRSDDRDRWVESKLLTLETSDGEPVTPQEQGRYEVLRRDGTQVEVTSDDVNAP